MKTITKLLATILCLAILCSCAMQEEQSSTIESLYTETTQLIESVSRESTAEATTAPTEPTTEPPVSTSESTLPSDSSFEIHFLDVGQADAALVLCDDAAMLIDGGNAADSSLIYAYLESHDIDYLDYVICTHPHEDHVGGLAGALNYATVGTSYCSMDDYDSKAFENFESYLAKQGKKIEIPFAGDTFSFGSAVVTILGPVGYYSDPNNMSIVLRIQYGKTSFLFAGDAEIDSEQDILNAGVNLQSTVLKVGHHGSDTSTSYRWLREIAPQYAVISVGKDNSYGHPTEQTLSRLEDAEATLYRTDLQGHIICTSDGVDVSFRVERNANADTYYSDSEGTVPPSEKETSSSESSSKTSYVLNTNTKKFHYPHCSSVKQMSDKNRQDVTLTREEIIGMGYSPCGRCCP